MELAKGKLDGHSNRMESPEQITCFTKKMLQQLGQEIKSFLQSVQ